MLLREEFEFPVILGKYKHRLEWRWIDCARALVDVPVSTAGSPPGVVKSQPIGYPQSGPIWDLLSRQNSVVTSSI